jgi:hypothetical protein
MSFKMVERLNEDTDKDIERANEKIADLTVRKGQAMKDKKDTADIDKSIADEQSKLAKAQADKAQDALKK